MAHSLESRLPFMDVRLVEFVFALPYDFKIHSGLGKYIHRASMSGIVPEFIIGNPRKYGFNTPTASFFSTIDSPANQILLSERCADRGVFDRNGLRAILEAQSSGRANHATFLFRLLSVELWFRTFIDHWRNDLLADQPLYGGAHAHA
jgi:asparagine synthase (glutamine-hydrolysing)